MQIKKSIITGGAGFIGLHLSKLLLKKKISTCVIDKISKSKIKNKYKLFENKRLKFIKVNLDKPIKKRLSNFSHVFHLAASLGVKNINKNPYKSFKNNLNSLLNLINNLKKNSPNCVLIYFSTSEVYSPLIQKKKIKIPTKENIDLLVNEKIINRDSYYLSKLIGEKIVQLSGLRFIILRPHNIYGPFMGYRHVISELIKRMNSKDKICKIYSPNHTRSFCYIDDAIEQIFKISTSKKSINQIINIGNSKDEIKIFDLAKMIKTIIKTNIKLCKGSITQGSPRRRVPDTKKVISISKLKTYTSLKTGIKKTAEWVQKKNYV